MLQARVEVREALHRHRQVLRYFVQAQETRFRHGLGLEIFADLRSHGAADWLVEGGEGVEGGLGGLMVSRFSFDCGFFASLFSFLFASVMLENERTWPNTWSNSMSPNASLALSRRPEWAYSRRSIAWSPIATAHRGSLSAVEMTP